jgi:2-C-methyl-D-erythritol 4-phosphate cytidylyltransferase/2-C-methyl-D-erythritol 2,4-cyclodiphosphate synthase
MAALAEHPALGGLVVVLARDEMDGPWAAAIRRRSSVIAVVAGGATRVASVRAGLRRVERYPFVLVHDAARPLAPASLIDRVIQATRLHGAAVPAVSVADTVKRVEVGAQGQPVWVRQTVDRSSLRLAQTPQGARTDWLREALDRGDVDGGGVTDEAAALEGAGHRVAVVDGDPRNRKITTPEDLVQARRSLEPSATELRIGTGFDIHRFGGVGPLMLGGVEFAGEPGLEGHSDADVVLHAGMDALLGAAGLGDIGLLFPPDDSRYAGADSRSLAAEVAHRVRKAGWEPVNLDLTLLAERPRIRTRADEMRTVIAESFGLAAECVGLKATTLEGLGALGRCEGVACQAVALLRRAQR